MTELPKPMMPDFGTKPLQFMKEVRAELKKVNWPTKDEVIKLTIVVVAISTLIGLYIGGLDLVLTKVTDFFIK